MATATTSFNELNKTEETNPWLITLTLMIGTLAAVMGSSTINTALPDIMSGLAINQEQVSWVATAYMLANVIAIPSSSWLGNLLSRRLLFGIGVAVFLIGSVLCGLAWDFSSMIAFRILQGLAAGLIMPTAQTLMLEAFPPEKRGMAMGVYGMGAIMGPALGPTVGGYLVALFGWRSIFFINLPFAIASLLMLNTLPRAPRRNLVFDAPGFWSMVIFLSTLQIAVSNGAKDGWDAPYILGCFLTSAIAFAYLIWRELTTEHPLLDLRVFTNGLYNLTTVISTVVGFGLFGSTFLVPVFLGNMLGYTALQIGLVMLPGSFAMGFMMLLAGRLSDSIDSRWLLAIGLGFFGFGLYMQTFADANTTEAYYAWAHFFRGVGMGLSFSPLSSVSLRNLPPQQLAQGAALFNLTRQLAGTLGIAGLNTLLTVRSTHHATMLGQSMSAQSPATQQFLAGTKAMLISRGMAPDQAQLGAFSMLGGMVRQKVTILAFSDLFCVLLAACVLGLVPILFLKPAPKKAPPSSMPSK